VALSLLVETADDVGAALELGVLADFLGLHHGHGPLTLANGHQVHAGGGDGEANHTVVFLNFLHVFGVSAGQLGSVDGGEREETAGKERLSCCVCIGVGEEMGKSIMPSSFSISGCGVGAGQLRSVEGWRVKGGRGAGREDGRVRQGRGEAGVLCVHGGGVRS
jgi:hypothetical protein